MFAVYAFGVISKIPLPNPRSQRFTSMFSFLLFISYWSIIDYSVVLFSGVHQSDLVIHIHNSILFQSLLPFRLLHNIEQSSLYYTVGPYWRLTFILSSMTFRVLYLLLKSLMHFDVDFFFFGIWCNVGFYLPFQVDIQLSDTIC